MNPPSVWIVNLLVVATRKVDSQPQPGIVEVTVFDAYGTQWQFIDKYPIFGLCYEIDTLLFPRAALLPCQVLEVKPEQNLVLVGTANPYQIYSTNDEPAVFWVYEDQLSPRSEIYFANF
ncbi:MAG: hypothetical protein RLZZ156_1725 [Deinococcota bacterium]|jgi:hypothetical protein